MKPELKFLCEEEVKEIHNKALKILWQTGMRMPFKPVLKILKEHGAKVSGPIVRMKPDLVMEALATAPKREDLILYGKEEKNHVVISRDAPVLCPMGYATEIIDINTGMRRPATVADLIDIVQLIDAMDNIQLCGPLVMPQDIPIASSEWYTWATCLKYTTKHVLNGVTEAQCVSDVIEMASLVTGSRQAFLDKPFVSFWILTCPPLQVDQITLESLMEIALNRLPIVISSGPICGLTAPVTLAGTITLAHAEILGCITVSQLLSPGVPVMYASFARSVDMYTGNVSMASPESSIMRGCLAQLGNYLGLPTRIPAMLKDAKVLDAQAGFENGLTGVVSAIAAGIIDGLQLDMDLLVDLADIVFGNECMAALKRLVRNMDIGEQEIPLDVINMIGHGGNYITSPHTLKYHRAELWRPLLFERRRWEQWSREGSRELVDVARSKVSEILLSPQCFSLDPSIIRKIDDITTRAALERKSRNK